MQKNYPPSFQPYVDAVLEKKSIDPVLIDVNGLSSYTDAIIICSGRSSRHVIALAEHVQRILKKQKIKPLNVEGKKDGQWVLMDYGDVIIHFFYENLREFYDLENLWADAKLYRFEENTDG